MKTPEAPSELFRDWQRTQNSIICEGRQGRGSKWMSGPAKAGTTAERRECKLRVLTLPFLRAPQTRAPAEVCFLLTIDLHGGQPSGQ